MKILVRFVSECITDPAQLRASMMQELRCLQGGDIWPASYKESWSQQYSIQTLRATYYLFDRDSNNRDWEGGSESVVFSPSILRNKLELELG